MNMIEASHLSRTYQRGDGTPVTALRDVSFVIAAGEFVVIRGASGSGKSSLLNILGCLDTPGSGSYRLAGEDVSALPDDARSHVRSKHVGFVFQSFNLLPRATAVENVELPALYTGASPDRARAQELLERVGLGARADHFATELSGGEQQRVAIARALIHHPKILVCDEPTSALDAKTGHSIMELLRGIAIEGDRAVMIVTHDPRIFEFADTMAHMEDGQIHSVERRMVS